MKNVAQSIAISVLLIAALSCDDRSAVGVPDQAADAGIPNQELEGSIIEILEENLRGRMDLFYEKQFSGQLGTVANLPDDGSQAHSAAIAMFSSREDGPGIDVGSVSVNGRLLAKQKSEQGRLVYTADWRASAFRAQKAGRPRYLWGVSGGHTIPAFEAAIDLPGEFSITHPLPGSSVARQDRLVVTWTGGSADITLVNLAQFQGSSDERSSGSVLFSHAVPDAGHFSIPAEKLRSISPMANTVRLSVSKHRYAIRNHGGLKFLLLATMTDFVEVRLE